MLGVSLRTAQLWVESGLLEAWKTQGGHRRISRDSVERLLMSSTRHRPDPGAKQSPGAAKGDARCSILVVEDDPDLRRLYQITLANWPFKPEVRTACDGYEALVLMGRARPDLLITDLRMDGMDGFRMLHTVTSMAELAGMTIVVVTGLDSAGIAARGGLPATIPVFGKPVPFPRLRAIAEGVATGPAAIHHP